MVVMEKRLSQVTMLWKNKSMGKFKKLMHIFYKRRYGVILKKWYEFRIIVGYLQKFFFESKNCALLFLPKI